MHPSGYNSGRNDFCSQTPAKSAVILPSFRLAIENFKLKISSSDRAMDTSRGSILRQIRAFRSRLESRRIGRSDASEEERAWRNSIGREGEGTHVAFAERFVDTRLGDTIRRNVRRVSPSLERERATLPRQGVHAIRNNGDLTVIRNNVPVYTSIGNTKCLQ